MGRKLLFMLVALFVAGCYQGIPPLPAPGLGTEGEEAASDRDDDDDRDDPPPPPPSEDPTTGGETPAEDESSSEGGEAQLPDVPAVEEMRLLDGLDVTLVEVSQAVSAVVGVDGEARFLDANTDPIMVRNRRTLFRASYVNTGTVGRSVEAVLVLQNDTTDETELVEAFTLQTTGVVEWTVNGSLIQPGLSYAVEFRTSAENPEEFALGDARIPAAGLSGIFVRTDAPTLRVRIVPVRHEYLGCVSTPDPDDSWYDMLEDHLWMQYPIADLELEIAEPWVYTAPMTDYINLLNEFSEHRVTSGLDPDVFAYAMVDPCDGGDPDAGGYGWVPDTDSLDGYFHTSMGRFWPDYPLFTINTILHEIGHNHGRQHVACADEGNVDPDYPLAGGSIGRSGWGMVDGLTRDASHADFMTYCDPSWISAYGWNLAYWRGVLLDSQASAGPREELVVAHEDGEGDLSWQTLTASFRPPSTPQIRLELWDAEGPAAVVPAMTVAEGETGRRSFAARIPRGVDLRSVRVASP